MWIRGGCAGDGSEVVHTRGPHRCQTLGVSTAETDDLAPLEFRCPRCQLDVTDEFYGPCPSCRTTLRSVVRADAREVASSAYEPKMNVTPNAVALKD